MIEKFFNFIDGKWVVPFNNKYYVVKNPANQEITGEFPDSTNHDAEKAIESASSAFKSWRTTTAAERVEFIYKFIELLERDKYSIAEAITKELGKPLSESLGEPTRGIKECRFMVGEASRMPGVSVPSDRYFVTSTAYRTPLGVIAAITPWNFPFLTPIRKIIPALIYGCTVVFKPASATPKSAILLVKLLEEAGIPEGVVNLVIGKGSSVGDSICSHPQIKGISFTGSTAIGRRINEMASSSFKKIQLEMGGKNPAIVMDYDDMQFAATQIIANAFANCGQRCTTISRVLVLESKAEMLENELAERIKSLKVGNGLTPGVQIGPLVNSQAGEEVIKAIDEATAMGASIKVGGKRLSSHEYDNGYFIEPTLLINVTPDMRVAREEVFGPLLSVIRVRDFSDAMNIANDTEYGLTSCVFTNNPEEEYIFMRDIDSGMGHINHGTSSEGHMPFGGVKKSGLGPFSIGDTNKEFYTNLKVIYKMFVH